MLRKWKDYDENYIVEYKWAYFLDRKSVYRDIEDLDADVICFQETRTKRRLTALADYCHYWNPCERDGIHGTMTLSKQEPLNVIYGLGIEELDKEGRILTIELPTLFVVNCYAPRAANLERHEFRQKWDNALRGFVKNLMNRGKQVVLCGDFNVLRMDIDVYPENDREFYAMQGLVSDERSNIEKLLEVGFIDAFRYKYPDVKNSYTFWSNRKHKREENRGWRLDYFFVSERATDAINDVQHLTDIQGSDHAPILLDLDIWFTDAELVEEWKQTDWIQAEEILMYHQQALTRAMVGRNFAKIARIQTAL